MNHDCLKLSVYHGERDRAGGGFLADVLVDAFARHELQTSLVLRGMAGFGAGQRLRTDRLLSLSEDLPLVSVAVDDRRRIETVAGELAALRVDGLVTLERARLLSRPLTAATAEPDALHQETKLTVYLGRRQRAGSRAAHAAVVDLLRRHGVAGATVLLGVDGTAHGARRRARLTAANADVPLMLVAVGAGARIAAALPELDELLPRPLVTLERVRLCKRDGRRLALPQAQAQKLTVYAAEDLHHELLRRLRHAGAAGATSLRGVWGYHGDHAPHGDRFWQLRRRAPVITVVVDAPARIERWFAIVDELTERTGLVTSEPLTSSALEGSR